MYDKRIAEPEFAALIEKKRNALRTANTVVGGLGCLGFFLGAFWLMATAGLARHLGLPALILCLFVIPGVFRLYARTGRHKRLLHLLRGLGILLLAAFWLSPLICIRFNRVPLLYPVKLFVFQAGVRAYPYQETVLPARLPKQHDDYYFRTEPGMIAQDYHPCEYLFLHTDADTLRAYDARLSQDPDFTRLENRSYPAITLQKMLENGGISSEEWAEYQNIPYWLFCMIRDEADMPDDLTHAVSFQGHGGAVLNYETGLLVIWN